MRSGIPTPNSVAQQDIIPFIAAAQDAGCRHVVYVSVFGADRARFIPHDAVEKALRESMMSSRRCDAVFSCRICTAISSHGVDIIERGELFVLAGAGRPHFSTPATPPRSPPSRSRTPPHTVTRCTT